MPAALWKPPNHAPAASHVIIADAAGTHSKTGPLASIDNGKALSLTTPALKAGTYKVTWNVLWVDCDSKSKGSYSFTIE
jgi:methionine-rich copper-binding protein CopC